MTDITREEFDHLKKRVDEIHDMLRSFKIVGAVAKWITTVSAGLAVVWHFVKTKLT